MSTQKKGSIYTYSRVNHFQEHYQSWVKEGLSLNEDSKKKFFDYFKQIEEPFKNLKSDQQSNFFSYVYCGLRFSMLLDLPVAKSFFEEKCFKGTSKLLQHELLWRKMSLSLGWPFTFTRLLQKGLGFAIKDDDTEKDILHKKMALQMGVLFEHLVDNDKE